MEANNSQAPGVLSGRVPWGPTLGVLNGRVPRGPTPVCLVRKSTQRSNSRVSCAEEYPEVQLPCVLSGRVPRGPTPVCSVRKSTRGSNSRESCEICCPQRNNINRMSRSGAREHLPSKWKFAKRSSERSNCISILYWHSQKSGSLFLLSLSNCCICIIA